MAGATVGDGETHGGTKDAVRKLSGRVPGAFPFVMALSNGESSVSDATFPMWTRAALDEPALPTGTADAQTVRKRKISA